MVLRQAPLWPGNETRAIAIATSYYYHKNCSVQHTKSARGRPGKEDTGVWFPTVVERLFEKEIY